MEQVPTLNQRQSQINNLHQTLGQVQQQMLNFHQKQSIDKNIQCYDTSTKYFGSKITQIIIKSFNSNKKQYFNPKILQVQTRGNIIALRDNQQNVWMVANFLQKQLNLCQLIKKKITKMFLDQKMIFLRTKKNMYLIAWDKINFPKETLRSIQLQKQFQHNIQCYQVQNILKNSFLYFCPTKKAEDQEIFFQIINNVIITHPLKRQLYFEQKVKGVSVSKTHALCWTESGQIYSWGQRSLALGHTQFQDIIYKNPKKINNIESHIVQAVSGTHYSLGLTIQGKLFQWGIKYIKKRQSSQIQQELIFRPRQVKIVNKEQKQLKIISVKGKFDNFGFITLNHQFYVWGRKIPINIIDKSSQTFKNNDQINDQTQFILNLQRPTKTIIPFQSKIVDFDIQESHIAAVTVHKNSTLMNHGQLSYWNHKKTKLSMTYNQKKIAAIKSASMTPLEKHQKQLKSITIVQQKENGNSECKIKQNFTIMKKVTQSLRNLSNSNNLVIDDKLSRFIKQQQSKEEYFKNIHQQQQILNYIMSPAQSEIQQRKMKSQPKIKFQRVDHRLRFSGAIQTTRQKMCQKQKRRKLKSACKQPSKLGQINHSRMDYLMQNSSTVKKKKQNMKLFKQSIKNRDVKIWTTALGSKSDSPENSYEQKLKKVLQKKKTMQSCFYKSTIKKMQTNSLEYRQKINEASAIERQKMVVHSLLQKTIFQHLIKEYITKTITNQIDQGRTIKIQIFARNLKFNRIQKNIRRLFIRTRINFDLKKIKQNHPIKYLKLLIVYKNFVLKWKNNKKQKLRQHCISEIVKNNLKNKISIGLLKVQTVTKRLQKVNQWLCLVKKQKIKCLNIFWKKNLLSIFKLSQQNEQLKSPNGKLQYELSFKQMYDEKVKQNPILKIQNYLESSPLFKVKMMQIHNIFSLLKSQRNNIQNFAQKTVQQLKINKNKSKVKTKLKIKDEIQQKFDLKNIIQNPKLYLLPYSEHSKIFTKLKNFQINILDTTKLSQKWIDQDKKVLNKIFDRFLTNNIIQYGKKMRKYRLDLANFVKQNYKQISQKRWKYIIEYNKIKTDKQTKDKKQKQVRKILRLVGYQNILNSDYLPQKHRVIDQAIKLKNCPKLPKKQIVFSNNEFRKLFKQYYQVLCGKAKVLRRL